MHLPKYKLTYVSVPKVACTSLKQFFFQVENGFPFRPFMLNGRQYIIHTLAPCTKLSRTDPNLMADHTRVAVVRDPVSRIVSCYTNKVLKEKKLHQVTFSPEQKTAGLVAEPSFDNFIDLLPEYVSASRPIRHHSRPLAFFLGEDVTFFDKVFSIRQLPELTRFVQDRVGPVPELPHKNKSKGADLDVSRDEIERNRTRIETMFARDIELFGAYM